MQICLPHELLMDIVEILFQSTPSRVRGATSFDAKPPWSCISNLVLASHALRAIGLKLWFYRLRYVICKITMIRFVDNCSLG